MLRLSLSVLAAAVIVGLGFQTLGTAISPAAPSYRTIAHVTAYAHSHAPRLIAINHGL